MHIQPLKRRAQCEESEILTGHREDVDPLNKTVNLDRDCATTSDCHQSRTDGRSVGRGTLAEAAQAFPRIVF